MTLAELRGDVVILACAISAGVHAALAPDHFEEGTAAGIGFVVSAVLLAVLAVVLTKTPSQAALVSAIAIFAGLIVAYALVVTTGVPVLHPDVEAVDGLALFTKAVEVAGIAAAWGLVRRPPLFAFPQPKGTLS